VPEPDGFIGQDSVLSDLLVNYKVRHYECSFAIGSRKFRNRESLNIPYITLLPKRDEARNVKDFRPISLVHSFAKLITKILANRLASHLD
jgi:hypothetical protein